MKTAEKSHLKTFEILLLIAMSLFLASGVAATRTQDQLAEKVVRLHVLAHSDSEEDQALNLQVRDAVLSNAEVLLAPVSDRKEAEGLLRGQLLELETVAEETVRAAGYDYPVSVELADTEFPTKAYEGFVLPAGEYLALRVLIGDAEGQNWWCVVYPPLCTALCVDVPATARAAGFSDEDVCLLTEESPRYVLKFKVVEFWESVRQNWNGDA